MSKGKLRRPSSAMMLAVNAAIDRQDKVVAQLMKEEDLDVAELEQRLLLRNGKHYDLNGMKRRSSRNTSDPKGPRETSVKIDGRTSAAKLFNLIEQAEQVTAKAQQELGRRPETETEPVKKVMAEIELLRRERAKLEEQISETEESIS